MRDKEYRGKRRNQDRENPTLKHALPTENKLVITSEHKPHKKDYSVDVARILLKNGRKLYDVRKMTGLSYLKMLSLKLIEWYHPFSKLVPNPDKTSPIDMIEVPNTDISWLRYKPEEKKEEVL